MALFKAGQIDEADALFRAMLARQPGDAVASYHVALILFTRLQPAEALSQVEQAIAATPAFAPLWHLRGTVQQSLGRDQAALDSLTQAIRIQPQFPEALLKSAVLLRGMSRNQEALAHFQQLLALAPHHEAALAHAVTLQQELGLDEAAIQTLRQLLKVNPGYPNGLGMLASLQLRACDWTDLPLLTQDILDGVRADRPVCRTMDLMPLASTARDQFLCAQRAARQQFPKAPQALWRGEVYRHGRIRLAYLSPDFREHPVSHLMAGILERHDRSRFETIAISIGPDDGSAMRRRMQGAFEHFVDLTGQGSLQIASGIRALEVDVLVDLAGDAPNARPDVLAHRPAPVQVGYLGYPGTLGTGYLSHILADRQVVPPEEQACYAEQVVYLPHTYLPTDNTLPIAPHGPSRAACGLPETGTVLCAFSHAFQLNPALFDCWMRLLQRLPGAVLWLSAETDLMRGNLRREAQARSVDPHRLVFAERVPRIEDQLARYRLADLFLDTVPCNAHAMAADALWAGLPVVTCRGDAFAGRVAASLLHAVGLPELIAPSLAAYEERVMQLASDAPRLHDVRQRLQAHRQTHPLFDTHGLCRDLEQAFATLHAQTAAAAVSAPDLALQAERGLVDELQAALATLAARPHDDAVLEPLAALRPRLAQALMSMDDAQFALRWPGTLEPLHSKLVELGIAQVTPTPADAAVLQKLQPFIDGAPATGSATRSLAASMLYTGPHLLKPRAFLATEPAEQPGVYRQLLFRPPAGLRSAGEAEACVSHVRSLLREIVAGLDGGRDGARWLGAALEFVNNASMIPLYFAASSLKDVMQLRARIIETLMANQLGAPGLAHRFPPRSRPKIRLGVLASHFGPQPETYATLPVYSHLDRQRFEVVLISRQAFGTDALEAHCLSFADGSMVLSGDLETDVTKIRALDLDALWIGTNVTAGFNKLVQLAAHRLARLQMTGGCAPVTTGLRHIDVFVSGLATEPDDAASHYSERLHCVPGPAHCFDMAGTSVPPGASRTVTRRDLGIGDDEMVFVSGANYFKIVPELLDSWLDILERTPNSRMLLFPFNPNWTSNYPIANFSFALKRRAAARGVAAERFVTVAPLENRAAVLDLLRNADLYLDSFPYSGMTSLLDPFDVGLPVVAMEGRFQRERMAGSALRSLGLQDWLAADAADYVARAVALAGDRARREAMRQALARAMAAKPKILEPAWFSQAVAAFISDELAKLPG